MEGPLSPLSSRAKPRDLQCAPAPAHTSAVCQFSIFARAASLLQKLFRGASRPTAVFAAHGPAISQLLHVLARLRMSVPRDVAILGFDDFDLFDLIDPPISVVRQPVSELGQTSAELLFSLLNPERRTTTRSHKRYCRLS